MLHVRHTFWCNVLMLSAKRPSKSVLASCKIGAQPFCESNKWELANVQDVFFVIVCCGGPS